MVEGTLLELFLVPIKPGPGGLCGLEKKPDHQRRSQDRDPLHGEHDHNGKQQSCRWEAATVGRRMERLISFGAEISELINARYYHFIGRK